MLYRNSAIPFILAAVLLLFAACDSLIDSDTPAEEAELLMLQDIAAEGQDVTAENIQQGTQGFLEERSFNVIEDEATFAELWENLYSHRDQVPERPEVNFDETYVVFAALGQRPTGGYSVQVTEARYMPDLNEVMIEVTERVPGENCVTTQALTFPFTVATVDAIPGASYEFEEGEPQSQDC